MKNRWQKNNTQGQNKDSHKRLFSKVRHQTDCKAIMWLQRML